MIKYEQKIKTVLREIMVYSGGDVKYAEYADMISRLEWFLKDCGVKDE